MHKKVNPLEGNDIVAYSAWLSTFGKQGFIISKELNEESLLVKGLPTGLCEAIDFITKDKASGYITESNRESVGKDHLAALIAVSVIEYANIIAPMEFYKIQGIKYLHSPEEFDPAVASLSKYIDMVYDYLQK